MVPGKLFFFFCSNFSDSGGNGEFKNGLFDCCGDCGACCKASCCPCLVAKSVGDHTGDNGTMWCLGYLAGLVIGGLVSFSWLLCEDGLVTDQRDAVLPGPPYILHANSWILESRIFGLFDFPKHEDSKVFGNRQNFLPKFKTYFSQCFFASVIKEGCSELTKALKVVSAAIWLDHIFAHVVFSLKWNGKQKIKSLKNSEVDRAILLFRFELTCWYPDS